MPKSVKSSKKTGRKPALTQAQKQAKATYMHERGKLLKNIRSLEKRGYTVNISVPAIPVKGFAKATERIRRLNERRYDLSSKEITVKAKDKRTGEYREIKETVKGTRAVRSERAQSARKSAENRKINKRIKSLERDLENIRFNDLYEGHTSTSSAYIEVHNEIQKLKGTNEPAPAFHENITDYEYEVYLRANGWWDDNPDIEPERYEIPDESEPILDPEKEYFYNWETGEIADIDELKSRGESGTKWDILSTMDMIQHKYEKVMDEFDHYISTNINFDENNEYDHPLITPEELKERIQEMYEEDPYYFNDYINMVEADPAYETPDLYYFYGTTDYGKYAYVYDKAFSGKDWFH